jgi:hypothetical protein
MLLVYGTSVPSNLITTRSFTFCVIYSVYIVPSVRPVFCPCSVCLMCSQISYMKNDMIFFISLQNWARRCSCQSVLRVLHERYICWHRPITDWRAHVRTVHCGAHPVYRELSGVCDQWDGARGRVIFSTATVQRATRRLYHSVATRSVIRM